MSQPSRFSAINQGEKAFAAYFNGNILGTVLQGVNGYAAHTLTPLPLDAQGNPTGFATLTPPFCVFTGSKPKQIGYDSGLYELTMKAHLEVQIDATQSNPGQDLFTAMWQQVRDMLEGQGDFGNLLIMNWLNSASPINFQNFGLSALVFEDEDLSDPSDSRVLIAEAVYYIGATTNAS